MAENVYIKLTANNKLIKGESSRESQGRKDLIEARQIHMGARTGIDRTGGKGTGSVMFDDFVLIKPIDRGSPLIYQALCGNERIELEAQFWRPNKDNGKPEHFYSIFGEGGRIISISQSTADGMDQNAANEEPCETIAFKFETIKFTYPSENHEFSYSRKNSD